MVIESFGSGGLPRYGDDNFFTRLEAYTAAGKTVVVGTQVEREGSALDVYEVGRRLLRIPNVLEARSMTLEATVTKLMWVLGRTKRPEEVARLFLTPVDRDFL